MQGVAASQTAMQEVAASQTAMQEVAASQTAMGEVANSSTAMGEVANSQTAVNAMLSDSSAVESVMDAELVNSSTALGALSNSNLLTEFSGSTGNSTSGFNITNATHFLIDDNPSIGGSANFLGNLSVQTDYSGNQFQKANSINFNAGADNRNTNVSDLFGVPE
jgi:hypothetical protein